MASFERNHRPRMNAWHAAWPAWYTDQRTCFISSYHSICRLQITNTMHSPLLQYQLLFPGIDLKEAFPSFPFQHSAASAFWQDPCGQTTLLDFISYFLSTPWRMAALMPRAWPCNHSNSNTWGSFFQFLYSLVFLPICCKLLLFLLFGLYRPAGNGWQSKHCIVSQLWLESVLLREHSLFLVISTFLFILDFSLFLYITSGHMYGRW